MYLEEGVQSLGRDCTCKALTIGMPDAGHDLNLTLKELRWNMKGGG